MLIRRRGLLDLLAALVFTGVGTETVAVAADPSGPALRSARKQPSEQEALSRARQDLANTARVYSGLASVGWKNLWDRSTVQLPGTAAQANVTQTDALWHSATPPATSKRFGRILELLSQPQYAAQLEPKEQAMVRHFSALRDKFFRAGSIGAKLASLRTEASGRYKEMKEKGDWASFSGYMARGLELRLQEAKRLAPERRPYDAMLYDVTGLNTPIGDAKLDQAFLDKLYFRVSLNTLRLLRRIERAKQTGALDLEPTLRVPSRRPRQKGNDTAGAASSAAPATKTIKLLDLEIDPCRIDAFGDEVMRDMGLDLDPDKTRVAISRQGNSFSQTIAAPGVVALAKKPLPGGKVKLRDALKELVANVHECGHALAWQRISPSLAFTELNTQSNIIHEVQAVMWQDMPRRKFFWERYWPQLREELGKGMPPEVRDQLRAITPEQFYRAFNQVTLSPVRKGADPLTFGLHTFAYYQLEKQLVAQAHAQSRPEQIQRQLADLPERFVAFKRRLNKAVGVDTAHGATGLVPSSLQDGAMQDTHWANLNFAYLPLYTVAAVGGEQLYQSFMKARPNFEAQIARGEAQLSQLTDWLEQKVNRDGLMYAPDQIMVRATGEYYNPKPWIERLKALYTDVYQLK